MYALIRKGNGEYYTSSVFAYFHTTGVKWGCGHRYWVVLNEEKTKLVNQPVSKGKDIAALVLAVDSDPSDWDLSDDACQYVVGLPGMKLYEMIESDSVPEDILQSCIETDRRASYDEYHYERIRKNLDAVRVPFGIYFKPSRMNCKQQTSMCMECPSFCTTKDDIPEYEAEIKRVKEQIRIGEAGESAGYGRQCDPLRFHRETYLRAGREISHPGDCGGPLERNADDPEPGGRRLYHSALRTGLRQHEHADQGILPAADGRKHHSWRASGAQMDGRKCGG